MAEHDAASARERLPDPMDGAGSFALDADEDARAIVLDVRFPILPRPPPVVRARLVARGEQAKTPPPTIPPPPTPPPSSQVPVANPDPAAEAKARRDRRRGGLLPPPPSLDELVEARTQPPNLHISPERRAVRDRDADAEDAADSPAALLRERVAELETEKTYMERDIKRLTSSAEEALRREREHAAIAAAANDDVAAAEAEAAEAKRARARRGANRAAHRRDRNRGGGGDGGSFRGCARGAR